MGLRVQDKIEKLLDKHMQSVGQCPLPVESYQVLTLFALKGLRGYLSQPSLQKSYGEEVID